MTLLLALGIPFLLLMFFYAFPSLTGWRALARAWPGERLRDTSGQLAHEVEVDWTWNYYWSVEVRIIESGVHCQHMRLIAPMSFHAPLCVPWSAITDVIETADLIEARAHINNIDFRVRYPARLGFPSDKRPNPKNATAR